MKIALLAFCLFISINSFSQNLVLNDETTTVTFVTKFLIGRLEGTFKGVDGLSNFDTANLANANFKMSFNVKTATTNDNTAGPDLIKKSCFNANQFPLIELMSDSITKGAYNNEYKFSGSLKIKGITQKISFPFKAVDNIGGFDFNLKFSFTRRRYGLKCVGLGRKIRVYVRGYGKRMSLDN